MAGDAGPLPGGLAPSIVSPPPPPLLPIVTAAVSRASCAAAPELVRDTGAEEGCTCTTVCLGLGRLVGEATDGVWPCLCCWRKDEMRMTQVPLLVMSIEQSPPGHIIHLCAVQLC